MRSLGEGDIKRRRDHRSSNERCDRRSRSHRSLIDERACRTRTARRSCHLSIDERCDRLTSALVDCAARRTIVPCDLIDRDCRSHRSSTRCDRLTSGAINEQCFLIWALSSFSLSLSLSLSLFPEMN